LIHAKSLLVLASDRVVLIVTDMDSGGGAVSSSSAAARRTRGRSAPPGRCGRAVVGVVGFGAEGGGGAKEPIETEEGRTNPPAWIARQRTT